MNAADALFIDDNAANVDAANAMGIASHLFTDAPAARAWLGSHGLPV